MSIKLIVDSKGAETTSWTFPGGERNIRIHEVGPAKVVTILCLYRSSDDLVDLILLTNACRNKWPNVSVYLTIPYFPFARQDRVTVPGEPHALQAITQVINMLNFVQVAVMDPHSDVLSALFPPGKLRIVTQAEVWKDLGAYAIIGNRAGLVSPDAGAAKKIYNLSSRLSWGVIEASKDRNPVTGKLSGCSVPYTSETLNSFQELYVVDDICDGGGTFIQLAETLRESGYLGKLFLCVTHGIFSKGMEVLESHYDGIYTKNNLSTNE